LVPLLARHGIRWIATDEEVLSASTHGFVSRDSKGHVRNPDHMYRPYKVREGEHELAIVFRDHALSDQIGFRYQHSDPVAAVADFLSCLDGIDRSVQPDRPALVSVILDGENCWEHYPGGGVAFLRELYGRCTLTPGIQPVTIGDYLERHPPQDTLARLFAGSWISHNFAIWIGHEEDNTAWDALHRTREYLLQQTQGPGHGDRAVLESAWRELYIAEGSDWFWWFGDDHSSAQDALFDYLFRKHLQNVYTLLGDEPPADLTRPISRRGHRVHYSAPRSLLEVTIDGRYTFFEWVAAGHYCCHNERGTMAQAMKGPLTDLWFGFDLDRLLIRVDCDAPARTALAEADQLRIGFVEPPGFEVQIDAPGQPGQEARVVRDGDPVPAAVEAAVDRIAEVAIPFDALGVAIDSPVQFFVEVMRGGQGRDRAPRQGTINLHRPSADFEQIMWDV
jgi:alpha-amylase/alpha-mannosidase (GH57 family)